MVFENYTARSESGHLTGINLISQVASSAQNDAYQACRQNYIHTQRYIDEQIRAGTKIISEKPFSGTTSVKTQLTDQRAKELLKDFPKHRSTLHDQDWNMTLVVNCTGTEYLLEGKKSSLYPRGEE